MTEFTYIPEQQFSHRLELLKADKKASPIRAVEQMPDLNEVWSKTLDILQFRRTYIPARRGIEALDVLQTARLSAAGFNDNDLTDTTKRRVASSREIVERALLLNQDLQERFTAAGYTIPEPTSAESRMMAVYQRLKWLPTMLKNEADDETDFGRLLTANPQVMYLFDELSKGLSLQDIMENLGITLFNSRAASTQAFYLTEMLLRGTTRFGLKTVSSAIVLAKAVKTGELWDGTDAAGKFAGGMELVLNTRLQKNDINYRYFNYLKHFFEALPLIHAELAKKYEWAEIGFSSVYPQSERDNMHVNNLNILEYIQHPQAPFMEPLMHIWQAYTRGDVDAIKDIVRKRTYINTMEATMLLGAGLNFSQAILLEGSNKNATNIDRLRRDVPEEVAAIKEEIAARCNKFGTN